MRSLINEQDSDSPTGLWAQILQLPPRVSPGAHGGSWQRSWLEWTGGKPNPSRHIAQVPAGYKEKILTE